MARHPCYNFDGTPKIAFDTRRKAKEYNNRTRVLKGGAKLRPYLCPECELWHLGHTIHINDPRYAAIHAARSLDD